MLIRVLLLTLAIVALAAGNSDTRVSSPTNWEPDHRATQETSGAGQDETAIAANPYNPDNAIAVTKDYRLLVRDYIYTTTDGGTSWLEQPFPTADPSLPYDTDPYVFFSPGGRAYIIWTAHGDFSHGGLFCAWSDDGGITWSPVATITPAEGHFDDKAWLAFDNTGVVHQGTIYAFWTRFGNAEIYAAWSTDAGATWSAPVQMSQGQYASNNDGAQPVVMPDGSLYVVFLHGVDAATGTLVSARSTDGGATWSTNTPLLNVNLPPFRLPGEQWRIFTYHALARDPVRGHMALVWPDYRFGATNGIDILESRSTDSGASWSLPARLNDDPLGLVRDQFFPAITAAPDGRLTSVWLDRREDPANRLFYAYARTSTDGGATWLPSARISSAPSDPNVNIPPKADGIGDYIGISAGPGVTWASWVDTRNGNQDIYAARERFTPQPTPTSTSTPIFTPSPTSTVIPCVMPFTDVSPADYFYEAVQYLYCHGVISGYGDNTFRPYNYMTRGQLSKLVVLAEAWPIQTPTATPTFRDVPAGSAFYPYVETAYSRGVVSGYGCGEGCLEYRPGNNITRAQVTKVIVLARNWAITPPLHPTFRDVPVSDPFFGYVETAYQHGVISGYSCGTGCLEFRPGNSATRGQISKVVYYAIRGAPQGRDGAPIEEPLDKAARMAQVHLCLTDP